MVWVRYASVLLLAMIVLGCGDTPPAAQGDGGGPNPDMQQGDGGVAADQGASGDSAAGDSTVDAGPSTLQATVHVDPPTGAHDFLVQVAVPVGSNWNGEAYLGGVKAQSDVISYDPTGAPDVVQLIARVPAGTSQVDTTETGTAPNGPQFFDRDLSGLKLRVKVANVTAPFEATLISNQSDVMRDGDWLRETRHWARFGSTGGAGTKVMGVHSYLTRRSDIEVYELTLHVSNAVSSASGAEVDGEVYFENMELDISSLPSGWVVLADMPRPSMDLNASPPQIVKALGPNQFHFMPARAGFVRRLVLTHQDNLVAAREILQRIGYGRATGANSYYQMGGYGESAARVPTLTNAYAWNGQTGIAAAKAKMAEHAEAIVQAVSSGGNDQYNANMLVDARGWYHPRGYKNGQATSGIWIHPSSGELNVREEWIAFDRWLRTERDRSPLAIYDPTTGEIITTQMLAAANTAQPGSQPFDISSSYGQLRMQVRYFVHPDAQGHGSNMMIPTSFPWNQPPPGASAPYAQGLKYYDLYGGPDVYGWWDAQHGVRGLSSPRVSIWALNDSYAKDHLRMWANHWQMTWTHLPLGPMTDSYKHYTSIHHLREKIIADGTAGWGGGLGRGQAWITTFMAARYAIEDAAWRQDNLAWFETVADIFHLSAMPTGVMQRKTSDGWSGSPNPFSVSFYGPTDQANSSGALPDTYEACQAFEQVFLAHAAYSVVKRVLAGGTHIVRDGKTGEQLLSDIVVKMAQSIHATYPAGTQADGPPKFLIGAEKDQPPAAQLVPWDFGSKETTYAKYHLTYAYKLTGDAWFRDRLKQVIGGGAWSAWIDSVMAADSGDPAYTHGFHVNASAIAELQQSP